MVNPNNHILVKKIIIQGYRGGLMKNGKINEARLDINTKIKNSYFFGYNK